MCLQSAHSASILGWEQLKPSGGGRILVFWNVSTNNGTECALFRYIKSQSGFDKFMPEVQSHIYFEQNMSFTGSCKNFFQWKSQVVRVNHSTNFSEANIPCEDLVGEQDVLKIFWGPENFSKQNTSTHDIQILWDHTEGSNSRTRMGIHMTGNHC